MFEIGTTLREARLRRGLDILQCEAETKIRAKYLRAMEEEHFELMPTPTYVRGFLRTYAEFLNLDGQLMLDEYESRFEFEQPSIESELWRSRRARPSSSRIAHGRPPAHRSRRSSSGRTRRPKRRRAELRLLWLAIGGVMGVALLVWMGVGGSGDQYSAVPGVSTDAPVAGASPTTTATDPLGTSTQEAPMPEPRTEIVLSGVGDIGSWLTVTSPSGRTVVDRMLAPGESQTFRIKESIRITPGNAAGLAVTIDGKETPLTGGGETWVLSSQGAENGQ